MANPNIFAQYTRPVRSMQEYAQDYDAAEQNKLALAARRMQMQQAQSGMEDQQRIRGLASQYGSNPNKLVEALRGGGYFDQAGAIEKQIQEGLDAQTKREKAGRDNSAADEKLFGDRWNNVRTFVGGINSPQGAEAYVRGIYADPVLGPRAQALQPLELALQEIPKDPATLPRWKAAMSAISAEKLIELTNPKMQTVNAGNAQVTEGIDQFTGQVVPGTQRSTPILESEAQRLAREQRADEAAKNRGVQIRGQNLTDARSREATAATMSKPFEVTGADGNPVLVQQDKQGNIRPVEGYKPKGGAEKPLNDTQSKALLFGSRMREAGKVLDALEKSGTTTSVPGSRAGYGVGPVITALSSAQKQQLDQAKRDFVNAVLRRESGAVIADSEFDNADKQYFPQIGDSKEVIAQKRRNRELATQGILQEVPENRRNGLQPQAQMPTADDIRKQADNILKGG